MKPLCSKERVLTAFARQEPDRVPVNYFANPEIDKRLKRHFRLEPEEDEGLRVCLGVDFRTLATPYVGPKLHADVPGRFIDEWGIRCTWVEHDFGGYWDYCDFALRNATLEEVEAWPMPSPDYYDYSQIPYQCRRWKDYCLVIGDPGKADIINGTGMVRTMERVLMDMAEENPAFLRYVERRLAVQIEVLSRAFEAAQGAIDLLWIGEDLGTQRGPTISLDMYRRLLRPWHQQFVDLGKACNVPVMMHCCGSSSWAFPDFIEMGIAIVDTLQPEAANMAPASLKGQFGTRLSFHGCISTAGPVAKGSVQDTIADARQTLEIMMPGGGYALAPTHCLQDNSPTENVVALYETAHRYGRYQ